jgi:hypothetical protein
MAPRVLEIPMDFLYDTFIASGAKAPDSEGYSPFAGAQHLTQEMHRYIRAALGSLLTPEIEAALEMDGGDFLDRCPCNACSPLAISPDDSPKRIADWAQNWKCTPEELPAALAAYNRREALGGREEVVDELAEVTKENN